MRIIIAGSRQCYNYELVKKCIEEQDVEITCVLSGDARGVDRLGEKWATENNIPVEKYPANWGEFGRSAGFRRNKEMAEKADGLIALWDGASKGTKHMIDIATKKDLLVRVIFYKEKNE